MSEHTDITWTDHTFNPWIGCHKISPGCVNCYAEVSTPSRVFNVEWGRDTPRHVTSNDYWRQPIRWDRAAAKAGRPALVFCASLADVFEDHPDVVEARSRLWELIEQTPNLIWLLLTKRPENVLGMVWSGWVEGYVQFRFQDGEQVDTKFVPDSESWPSNVWIGTTIENQAAADERLPILARIPAPVRFLSCEPLLGPVDLSTVCEDVGAEWVIVGGESGPNRRPFDPTWALDIRDQCANDGTPFFYKQGSDARAGADPLLDGEIHHNWPKEAQR